ncbi:Cytochrome c oxidase assembly factor 3 mitochondrial [Trinorchestia longiramus]|nr:Cytochrome c oxidase assembly factor 3 mitochondrial [Trinorchestia longiramus]
MSSSGSENMPKLNLEKDMPTLSSAQKQYMKIVEKQNIERAEKLLRMRRRNKWLGSFLGLGVLTIYGYSIFSVKQEKFLDELDD